MILIPLTEDVQLIILVVQAYKKHIMYDYEVKNPTSYQDFDWWDACENYYKSLPLPNGMNKSKEHFEAVMNYPIDKTENIDSNVIKETFTFPYSENFYLRSKTICNTQR